MAQQPPDYYSKAIKTHLYKAMCSLESAWTIMEELDVRDDQPRILIVEGDKFDLVVTNSTPIITVMKELVDGE